MTPRRWAESGLRALDKPGSQSRGQPTPPRGGAGQAPLFQRSHASTLYVATLPLFKYFKPI